MPQPLNEAAVTSLHATIAENDELVGTRYGWEGEYAITTITLRKHVGSPLNGARPVGTGSGPDLRIVDIPPPVRPADDPTTEET